MRERIWRELVQAIHNTEFACLYAKEQRKYLTWFNISILVFSSGGVLGWPIWNEFAVVTSVIVALMSLIRLVQPHFIMNDKQLSNLDKIYTFYSNYRNELEKLWFDFEEARCDSEKAHKRFYNLKETEKEISITVNETVRKEPKKLVNLARKHSIDYISQVFGYQTK